MTSVELLKLSGSLTSRMKLCFGHFQEAFCLTQCKMAFNLLNVFFCNGLITF